MVSIHFLTVAVGIIAPTLGTTTTQTPVTSSYFDWRNALGCRDRYWVNDDWRKTVVNFLNAYRQSVANGTAKNKTGNLPAAKNMYQLFYNCKLEDFAMDWAGSCGNSYGNHGTGTDQLPKNSITFIGDSGTSSLNATQIRDQLISLLQSNLSQIVTNGIGSDLIYNNVSIQGWNSLVTSAKTAVGCGYKADCYEATNSSYRFKYYIACVFDEPSASLGQPAYEVGSKCEWDSDCTTYPRSQCDSTTGLCNYLFYPSPTYYAQNWDKLDLKELIYGLVPRGPYAQYAYASNPQVIVGTLQKSLSDVNNGIDVVQQLAEKAIPVLQNFDQTGPDMANKVMDVLKQMGIRI